MIRGSGVSGGWAMRPSCRIVGRLLQSYLDDELDGERTLVVAAHVHDCVRCGLDAASYRWLSARLSGLRAQTDDVPLRRLHAFAGLLTREPI